MPMPSMGRPGEVRLNGRLNKRPGWQLTNDETAAWTMTGQCQQSMHYNARHEVAAAKAKVVQQQGSPDNGSGGGGGGGNGGCGHKFMTP